MPKIEEFDFTTTGGIVATLSHEQETSRLEIAIKEMDGTSRTMHFNNIGEDTDPLDFIETMDWDYVKNKLFGNSARKPDFLKSVASIYTMMHDYANYGMEAEVVTDLTALLKRTMTHYDGNDEVACSILVSSMRRTMNIDDCHHLIQHSDAEHVNEYRDNVWGPLQEELGHFVGASPFGQVEEDDDLEIEM